MHEDQDPMRLRIRNPPAGQLHTVVRRRATIANDRLTLELVEPLVIDGRPRGGRLTWERVEVFEALHEAAGSHRLF